MTQELAEYKVRFIAESMGYKFDDDHYFEFIKTWAPSNNKDLLSYIFFYHKPIEMKNGFPLPVGEPIYWICNDSYTGPWDVVDM